MSPASGIGTTDSPAPRTSPSQAIATWTNPLGGVRQLAVDSMGNIVRDGAPNGAETNLARNTSLSDSDSSYAFTRDISRLTFVSSVRDGLTNYSHDATNQLTAADHTGQIGEVLSYDALWRRIKKSVDDNGNGRFRVHLRPQR